MKALLDLFPGVSVAVIGDLMLDCYLYGDVSRISPEAPVPVMRALSERVVAGGAANVAANLADARAGAGWSWANERLTVGVVRLHPAARRAHPARR
jgi:bifunctional ADP-heptose synthase (sugar kinase/adenylyltransferase)